MTAEEEKTIRLLETRTRQLILKFEQLKAENSELLDELVAKDSELAAARKRTKELESDLTNLKMARMLSVSDTDIGMARQRVSRLVRDVDKCIALLKGMEPGAVADV
ncbi:MAG: hypothetical protein IJS59_06930 [Bacteroidaceae bacterium]|nr:hypothetical protein [Bacteroidaceae bacterium]